MDLLRLATAGSVDDGKSTLIGRLLLDAKLILEDHLEALDESSRNGEGPDLASITDGLRAEREQGITIDVAYRFFQTEKRSFIIADTPGHERYTRNMVSGASTADLALILLDARGGIVDQSRRHASLSALLGIKHVVACVNKMDLVDWDEDRFRAIESEFGEMAERLDIPDARVIPIAALHGDNVVDRSEASPWYDGPLLLEHLEQVEVRADPTRDALRLPVQWTIRPRGGRDDERSYAGQLAGGTLAVGDAVTVLPAGVQTTIAAIETFEGTREDAVPPLSVAVRLADDLDVGRGDLICSPVHAPVAAREIDATVAWMGEAELRAGARYALKHTTRTVRATVQAVHSKLDMTTLEDRPAPARLKLNDIGRLTLRTSAPVLADHYADNRVTVAFILIDEHTNDTVGAGMVEETREREPAEQARRDVTWHDSELERDSRWKALGHRGATVWLTGLPASGKSTIAAALERRLVEDGRPAYLLDGDNVRHGLSDDLGFEPGERSEHIRRVAHVARLLADAGVVAVVSLVSPMAADRRLARELHDAAGLAFHEVFVSTPVEECERRDPKGLYVRARAGRLPDFTGVDAPYEAPEHPDFAFDTSSEGGDDAVARLLEALRPV
jgi:bifunctional enzyme CysN/CysC